MDKSNSQKKLVLVMFFALVFSLALILLFSNIGISYAQDNSQNNVADDELSTEWQDDCINDMNKHITVKNAEELTQNHSRVWHVKKDKNGNKLFNHVSKKLVGCSGDEENFEWDYDVRGDLGDTPCCYHREPNVEFFYNTNTNEMAVLAFGPNKHGYKTYNYCSALSKTVFDDVQEFESGFSCEIRQTCKKIFLDTQITNFGDYTFMDLYKLEQVHMCNGVWTGHIDFEGTYPRGVFYQSGKNVDRTDFDFVHSFPGYNQQILISSYMGTWAGGQNGYFDGKQYTYK